MFKDKMFLALIVKKFVSIFENYRIETIVDLIDNDIRLDFVHADRFDEGCFVLDKKHATIQEEIISYDVRFFVRVLDENEYVKVIINFNQNECDINQVRDMSACYLASHNAFINHEDCCCLKAIYHLYACCDPKHILQCEIDYSGTLLNGFSDKNDKIKFNDCFLILNILKYNFC